MFGEKQQSNRNTERANKDSNAAKSFEESQYSFIVRNAKVGWFIAGIQSFLVVILAVAIFIMMPLKQNIPFLIKLDKATGIIEPITQVTSKSLTANKALDRYFVNNYVQIRESYTWQTIPLTYTQVQLFSDKEVAKSYRENFNKDKILKKGTEKVKVISISLEKIGGENLASVRLKAFIDDGKLKEEKNYIVKMAYIYEPQLKLKLSNRNENPLGFLVTSYQITEEDIK